jgi:NADH dehydrogenase [ubiquinone] 1 alpha subcomplex assembly factor 7
VSVDRVIARTIRDEGPIPFDRFMTLALYGPGGYYERPPVGADGDFVTSPHVHPVFAELLARAVVDLHGRLGSPAPFRIWEVGAGDGTLARALLERLGSLPTSYVAVERSPGARATLSGIDGLTVAERLGDEPHVILANELLDNLPFRRLRGTDEGTREVAVTLEGDAFVEVAIEPREPTPDVAAGEELVVPDGALAFVDEVAARLARPGYGLLIDYGGAGEPSGPAHGYRRHRPVADLVGRPGMTDITAGVDFDLLASRAEAAGLVPFPTVTQRHALTALGFDRWIRDELRRQAELLDRRRGLEAVRTWGGRSRATLLVDPSALGRLRWLVLATPGLPPPPWIRAIEA